MTKKELIESWAFQNMDENTEIVVFIENEPSKFYRVTGVTSENGFFDQDLKRHCTINLPYTELMAFKLDSDAQEDIYKIVRYKKIGDELHDIGRESPQDLLLKLEKAEQDAKRMPPGVMSGSPY